MTQHDTIRGLNARQQAREKLPVWFGSRDNFYHAVREVLMNGTDEIIGNFDSGEVTAHLHDDCKRMTIIDTGRGLPIGEADNLELLLLTMFAGGKYDTQEGATFTGTNGCGLTVTNYTSMYFKAEAYYGGQHYLVEFEDGGTLKTPLTATPCSPDLHGTAITFELDHRMYSNTVFNPETVEEIVKRVAVGSNKVTATFMHKDRQVSYHYDNLKEYYDEQAIELTCEPTVGASKMFDDEGEQTTIELVLATSSEPFQETYLNLTHLKENGAVYDGITNGAKLFLSKYCRDNKLFPKGTTSFNINDIEASLSFVVSVLSNNVEFQSQTKFSTQKELYKLVARKYVAEVLELFSIEKPKQFKKMLDHLLLVQKHNEKSSKAHKQLKKKLNEKVGGIGQKVASLVDSKKNGPEAELYVAEGNSALGSIVLSRDAIFQAAYALRGKILNCLKADYDTILKNQVILDLIKSMGCGIQADKKNKELESFDISNLRYGKIIIATDADADGEQIACLIITMIYRLMRPLLDEGMVYIAQTPLYEVKLDDDSMLYIFNEAEKEAKLATIKGKYTIARMKGLGEMSAETMYETAMNPETRNLIQVTAESAKKMIAALETWMGTAVDGRKEIIGNELYKYVENLD
jgi:DNA gyrase subunit B